jgi:hypothetical protein
VALANRRRLWRCWRAASSLRSRAAKMSCSRPASLSVGGHVTDGAVSRHPWSTVVAPPARQIRDSILNLSFSKRTPRSHSVLDSEESSALGRLGGFFFKRPRQRSGPLLSFGCQRLCFRTNVSVFGFSQRALNYLTLLIEMAERGTRFLPAK